MAGSHHRKGRWIIGITFVVAIVLAFYSVRDQSLDEIERVVQQEDIHCISALCISDGSVNKCLELQPSLSHVIITDDPIIQDANRLIVKPTENSCGRGSILRIESNKANAVPEPQE